MGKETEEKVSGNSASVLLPLKRPAQAPHCESHLANRPRQEGREQLVLRAPGALLSRVGPRILSSL